MNIMDCTDILLDEPSATLLLDKGQQRFSQYFDGNQIRYLELIKSMTVNKDGPEAGYWHFAQEDGNNGGRNNYQGDTVSRYSRTSRVSGRSNINRIISKNLKKNSNLLRTLDGRHGMNNFRQSM